MLFVGRVKELLCFNLCNISVMGDLNLKYSLNSASFIRGLFRMKILKTLKHTTVNFIIVLYQKNSVLFQEQVVSLLGISHGVSFHAAEIAYEVFVWF